MKVLRLYEQLMTMLSIFRLGILTTRTKFIAQFQGNRREFYRDKIREPFEYLYQLGFNFTTRDVI